MAQQIVIDIVAETKKLTEGFNEIDKEVKNVSGKLKGLTSAAAAAASAFVLKQGVTFLKQGIDEAKDAAAAMRAATTTFGEGSAALKKITDDAEKFGKQLAVDNDDIIKMSTSLGSRLPKDLQASSAELVKTFLDVQAFTNGAIDAESASSKLAKAFADGGLKAGELNKIFPGLNQSIYNQAEALSKAGKNQEAVNLLLTEGAKVYQDAAAKNATSTQKFEVALANFKEELGTKVLPVLEKFLGFLTDLLDAFSKQPKALQNIELALLAIVAIGGPLLTFIANIKTALTTLGLFTAATEGATIATNLMSVAMRAIPILAIIAGVVLLIQHWDDVSAAAKKVWEAINKWWGSIYEDIKDFADKAIKWLKENWPLILGVLTGPFGLFAAWIITHKDDVVAKFKDLWESVKTAVTEKVEAIIKGIAGWWNTLRDYLAGLFTKGKDTIFSAVEDGWNAVKNVVLNILDFLIIDIGKRWLEIGLTIIKNIATIVTTVIDKFTEMKDKAIEQFNKLKDSASKIWDNIKGFITDVATKIKEKLDTVYNDMVEVGKDIANGIIDGLFRIQGVFRTKLAQWVKDNIPDWIKKVLQISSPSKVMVGIGTNIAQGLTQGLTGSNTVPVSSRPVLATPASQKPTVNVTINAGAGTDPYALGRTVQTALNRYSRVSNRTGNYTAL